MDTLIAAHAMSQDMNLVTYNMGGVFAGQGATLENWADDKIA
jgi:predicted nucleic acid-binding protein